MKNADKPYLPTKIKIELERTIKRLYVNKELIAFMKAKIPNNAKDGLAYLHYFKKLVQQVFRSPDPDHYKAFKEEYEAERIAIAEEQAFYDPVKWLNAEIEYLLNTSTEASNEVTGEQHCSGVQASAMISMQWLTKLQVMDMLQISKTTLNRRISQGMPCHRNGKSTYFNMDEINHYLRQ
jgi:hypothetical protein